MNERIKELALQAENYAAEQNDKFGVSYKKTYNQKFAELIVRECCVYLEHEAERLYGLSASEADPIFQSNFELCAEKCYDNSQGLKDHFGVEE